LLAAKKIGPLARPIVSGPPEVGVFRNGDRLTGITALVEPPFAFPGVAVGD
jgi:hypothetical protein